MSARERLLAALSWLQAFASRRWRLAVGLALLVVALSLVDIRGSLRVLAHTGPVVLAVSLATFAISILWEAFAWRVVARSVGARLSIGRAVQTRLGMDSIGLVVPGGTLTADVSGPFLLRALVGVPLSDAVSIVLLRKWGTLAGQTLFFVVSLFAGSSFLDAASRALGGRVDLRVALGAVAVLFVGAAFVSRELLRRGPAERLGAALARIPWKQARRFVEKRASGLIHADANTSAFFDARDGRALDLVGLSFGRWIFTCVEGLWVLTLLGASPRLGDMLAFQSLMSVLRTLAFFVPAGLGARELGSIALVAVLPGGTAEIAAAAVLLRRAIELVTALAWLAVSGYTPFHARGRHPSSTREPPGAPPRGPA